MDFDNSPTSRESIQNNNNSSMLMNTEQYKIQHRHDNLTIANFTNHGMLLKTYFINKGLHKNWLR